MGRIVRGLSRFTRGFADGYNLTNTVAKDFAMADAARSSPEEMSAYTPDQGNQLEAAASAKDEAGNPLYKVGYEDGKGYTVAPTGGGEAGTIAPVKNYSLGGLTRAQPFSADEINTHRLKAMGDVALRFGSPVEAAQFDALAAKRRQAADDEQVRAAFGGGGLGQAAADTRDSGKPVSTPSAPSTSATPGLSRVPTSYLESITPRVMDTYLRQGKIAEAKAFRDFAESEQGRAYANEFAAAQRMVTAGDYDGAAPVLERLYNRDYNDDRQMKVTNAGKGKFQLQVFDQKSGELIGSEMMPASEFGRQAIHYLSPMKLVEFMATNQAKRDTEAATLDRQITLENLRQQGREAAEDRRDGRLQQRLDAQTAALERRLAEQGRRGGLTLQQQRQNFEIDAAREMIDGLGAEDIRQRTTPTTASGRENPLFDPGLARAAKLASRRKIGDDGWFDARQGQQPGGDSIGGKPLGELTDDQLRRFRGAASPHGQAKIDVEQTRRRFAGDQAMQGHTLGEPTPKGFKVFDAQGRHVGYYR